MFFVEVPATGADDQHRRVILEPVLLAFGAGELDFVTDRVTQIDLALDHVLPGRRQRVLAVSHEYPGAGIQRIDHHLAVGGAGNLDAAILEVVGDCTDAPVVGANLPGRGEEIGEIAFVDLLLPLSATRQQCFDFGTKALG